MHYRVETGNAMSPELEKYLQMDDRLASDIARLTLDLKDEERMYQQALGHRKGGSTWREFIVITIIAVLVLIRMAPALSRIAAKKEDRLSFEKDISYKFDEKI